MLQNLDTQHTDSGSSYDPYYRSHFQNPNPSSNPTDPPPPPQFNPSPSTFASAPPVSSLYSSTEYPVYSSSSSSTSSNYSTNPSYPQYTYPPNPNYQSSDPSPQPFDFSHLNPQTTPCSGFGQNQIGLNYDHSNPSYNSNANSSFSLNSYSSASNYENLYGSNYERYGEQGIYGDVSKQRPEMGLGYDHREYRDSVGGDGVYLYGKGKVEPYGARGSGTGSSSGVIFDDYGRPIGFENGKEQDDLGSSGKVLKAIPKSEAQQDVGSGVHKYRARLLSEGADQTDMDVLCQIGLDGIRILDTATSRTLRIYPLETVTRCEVLDSHIFAFWAKSSIDSEPRRIRLKSNSYTTNNILDTVMAATFQIKEMGGRDKPSNTLKISEQPSDKKKGLVDWMNLMKPPNEEKDHWVPDEAVTKCMACRTDFGAFVRRHHCRNCGDIFCDKCTQGRISLTADEHALPVRVCDGCMAEVTQRMANAKETTVKVAALKSHEDLAKKLEEEMDKNRKTSTGLTSGASGMQMKEVACPTCTVHLQVHVPNSGSETIECSVCQHPFLVGN